MSGPAEALQSIDRLVDVGVNWVTARPDAPLTARSVVALGGGRAWLVALAGDRSLRRSAGGGYRLEGTTGAGLTLHDFASFLISAVHAEKALNLDGAISTQLAVSNGRRRFEVVGERGTIHAVVLRASHLFGDPNKSETPPPGCAPRPAGPAFPRRFPPMEEPALPDLEHPDFDELVGELAKCSRNPLLTGLTSILGENHEPGETVRRVRPLELSFRSTSRR